MYYFITAILLLNVLFCPVHKNFFFWGGGGGGACSDLHTRKLFMIEFIVLVH